eukprot:GHVS01047991.1.p1 GENE.GHVS01047991.1~~GHVS01047991.1.p1  ORF type:complete len:803 (+),score=132.47 GHVS01047991.1:15-2423(+)
MHNRILLQSYSLHPSTDSVFLPTLPAVAAVPNTLYRFAEAPPVTSTTSSKLRPGDAPAGWPACLSSSTGGHVCVVDIDQVDAFKENVICSEQPLGLWALFEDGSTSLRVDKKAEQTRLCSHTYDGRFPRAVAFVVTTTARNANSVQDSPELQHFVLPMFREEVASELWMCLLTVVERCAHPRQSVVCFDVQRTLRPILQRYPQLATKLLASGGSLHLLDPVLMWWLLHPADGDRCASLDYMCEGYSPGEKVDVPHWSRVLDDGKRCLRVAVPPLWQRLEQHGLWAVMSRQEVPIAVLLSLLDIRGVAYDESVINQNKDEISAQLKLLSEEAQRVAGVQFSITSPIQVSNLLFNVLHIGRGGELLEQPASSGAEVSKHKADHFRSTSDGVLESLVDQHPVVRLVQLHRQLSKLLNTFIDPYKAIVVFDGSSHKATSRRLFTQWNQTRTVTGRLSSSNPNLQNIPKALAISDLSMSFNCRDAIRACDGQDDCTTTRGQQLVLVSADYSQVEMRLLAHFCEAGRLRALFAHADRDRGEFDVYRVMAQLLDGRQQGKQEKRCLDVRRRRAKAACLGLIYGSGIPLMAKQMGGVGLDEAAICRSEFLALFPEVSRFIGEVVVQARRNGYITTWQGRKRWLSNICSTDTGRRKEAERHAVNTKIQGSASDLMKASMLTVQAEVCGEQHHIRQTPAHVCCHCGSALVNETKWKHPPRLLLSVHDELVVECAEADVSKVVAAVVQCMTAPCRLSGENSYQRYRQPIKVSLAVSVKVGPSWGTMSYFHCCPYCGSVSEQTEETCQKGSEKT